MGPRWQRAGYLSLSNYFGHSPFNSDKITETLGSKTAKSQKYSYAARKEVVKNTANVQSPVHHHKTVMDTSCSCMAHHDENLKIELWGRPVKAKWFHLLAM